MEDPIAWPAAVGLKACFCALLAAEEPVCDCCIMYGTEVAIDSCDPGYAWVRVVSEELIELPNVRCLDASRGPWRVTLELGVMRCVPTMDDQGRLPTCAQHEAVAKKILEDKHRMRRAVACCEWAPRDRYKDPARVTLLPWQPIPGPEGLCSGGTMQVQVEANACLCPELPA
jgi:hypothetical protein